MKRPIIIAAAMAGVVAMAQLSNAYSGPAPSGGGNGDEDSKIGSSKEPKGIATNQGIISLAKVSRPATSAITSRIGNAADVCRQLDAAYYVDCLGERLEALAAELSSKGDYGEAQKIIEDASKKLRRVAAQNRDRSKPRVRVPTPKSVKSKTTRPIVATKPEAQKEVRAQAEAIIAETQTLLLRSAANSAQRKSHYEQIAAAVGSETKVLLRSL